MSLCLPRDRALRLEDRMRRVLVGLVLALLALPLGLSGHVGGSAPTPRAAVSAAPAVNIEDVVLVRRRCTRRHPCRRRRASRSAPRAARRDPSAAQWAALRQCESGGNYANKSNRSYRGAYQFSFATWRSVGGGGDPADASVEEQDARALTLYRRSGRGQWPTCGPRHLP